MTKYDECKKEVMQMIMKEYEEGKLRATSRKQAIAIGLSISDSNCTKKLSKKDYQNMENKIDSYVEEDKNLSVTVVKESVLLYKYYKSKRQNKKANDLKNKLMLKVLKDLNNNKKLSKLIYKSLLELYV